LSGHPEFDPPLAAAILIGAGGFVARIGIHSRNRALRWKWIDLAVCHSSHAANLAKTRAHLPGSLVFPAATVSPKYFPS
jgi:hypothetical protein